MIVKNVTVEQLEKALAEINEKTFEGNIVWKQAPVPVGRRFKFTLTVKQSAERGGRRGFSGKRVAAACWHVHGHFFDAVFALAPDAEIRPTGKLITLEDGNWEDQNIGSAYRPMMYSDACDCETWVYDHNFI